MKSTSCRRCPSAMWALFFGLVPLTRAQVPPLAQGPGGPVLLIGTATNSFSYYYAEILRAEGLNEFGTADISTVTAATLSSYDVVILGQMALSSAQVSMFTTWVNNGGHLIVMRPDKQLAGLLGLADAAATVSNAYLLINTATSPGAGLVSQTIQFHGTADLYTLNGAASIATLYRDASTATSNPAVAWRSVGTSGGSVAAFTYDLALSIVYTRQGNPAWAGQNRDGFSPPFRSDDMFFGNAPSDSKPDWNNLSANQVVVPIADEQQRLFANLILFLNVNNKPLPRFWYFPFGKQAVVMMTQDDHYSGAAGRFDLLQSYDPVGCSIANWECMRASAYVYPGTNSMTASQAVSYTAKGFEVGAHIAATGGNCLSYTSFASLNAIYSSMLTAFASQFIGIPPPSSQRTHCVVWSDYTTQADVEFSHGIRLDDTYYYYPYGWNANPGHFTGSGMPMRFGRTDGSMIDVYEAATQVLDEGEQTMPDTINLLLANATGPHGYYAVVTVNAHTGSDTFAIQSLMAAKQYGAPLVSGRQMLQWLDGRNSSSFGSFTWFGGTLSFTITLGTQTNGIQAMIPSSASAGALSSLAFNNTPVTYTLRTVKGIQYAVFSASAGNYRAQYGSCFGDCTPPTVSITSPTPNQTVSGTFNALATASDNVAVANVQFKLDGSNLGSPVTSAPYQISWNTTGTTNGPHSLIAVATDTSNNSAMSTAVPVTVSNLDTTPPTVSITSPTPNQTVSGTFNALATASDNVAVANVQFKLDGSNLGSPVTSAPYQISWNTTGTTNGPHALTAVATDTSNNSATSTAVPVTVNNVSVSGNVKDTTVSDFSAGTGTNTYISQIVDGEVIQSPTVGTEFSGTAVPSGWTVTNWSSGGSATLSGGTITVDGALVGTSGTYAVGRSLDFVATFTTEAFQHVGFGVDLATGPWAIFSTANGGALYARSNPGSGSQDTVIPGNWLGTPHHYRVDWTATSVVYWIDGMQVVTHAVAISTAMRPLISDLLVGGQKLVVDWMHLSPYSTPATFTSRVLDAGVLAAWGTMSWTADQPTGTTLAMSVRTGNTSVPDGTWTAFTTVSVSGASLTGITRYIQYQATLSTTDPTQTAVLRDVTITFGSGDTTPPTVSITAPTPNQTVSGVFNVTATASDNVAVANVQFKLDGSNLGSPVTSAPYQISWNTTSATNGAHSLTAVATDTSNNSATSTAVPVTVSNDTTPPTVSITSPTPNQTVSGTFNVTATASDNVAVANVQFKLDGSNLGSPVTSAPYQISWNTTGTTNGPHSLTAVATDTSNNSATSTAVPVTVSNLDTIPPTVSITSPTPNQTVSGAFNVTATASDNVAVANVQFKLDGSNLGSPVTSAPYQISWNTIGATNGPHSLTAVATDTSNNSATSTAVPVTVNNVSVSGSVSDTTVNDFSAGTGSSIYISQMSDGEVIQSPAVGSEFSGNSLPLGWSTSLYNSGGFATVANGLLSLQAAKLTVPGNMRSGSMDFVATFTADPDQHIGFGVDLQSAPWAIISTDSLSVVMARTNPGTQTNTVLSGTLTGAPHHYRIDWTASGLVYWVDGAQVAAHPTPITTGMQLMFSNEFITNHVLNVDWIHVSPYASNATFLSRVLDAGASVPWLTISWTVDTPAGTTIAMSVRTGDTPVPDGSWTTFTPVSSSGASLSGNSRYIQYQSTLSTTDPTQTVVLRDVTLSHGSGTIDNTPPTVSITSPTPNQTVSGAFNVTATASDNVAVANVQFKLDGSNLGSPVTSAPYQISWNTTGTTNGPHALTAVATDTSNNSATSTAIPVTVNNVSVSGSVSDTTVSDFSAGTGTNTYISQIVDGEVIQSPTVGTEFSGTAVPSGWTVTNWSSGGSAAVSGGTIAVDGALVGTVATYAQGRSLDFVATFTTDGLQHAGFGVDMNSAPWAIFSTSGGGALHARSNGSSSQDTVIPGNWLGTPHHYRIDWTATNVVYWIDGVQVVTHAVAISTAMRPLISDFSVGGQKLVVDWMHLSPYSTPATFTSRVLDAGTQVSWGTMSWTADLPSGTTLAMSVRTGNTSVPDGTWTAFTTVSASGASLTGTTRYIQYQATLSTTDPTQTAVLRDVTIAW
jgi:hypothetical protein